MADSTKSAPENETAVSVEEMEKQIAELVKKVSETRASEHKRAIQEILASMVKHNVTLEELQAASTKTKRSSTAGIKIPPKYRNPATGETWTGRGRAPVWMKDRDKAEFLI